MPEPFLLNLLHRVEEFIHLLKSIVVGCNGGFVCEVYKHLY